MNDGPTTRQDIVIIGGGLVGVASAYYLAQRGASVVLLERQELNRQASGRNAGSLHFQIEQRLVSHGEAMARQAASILPLIVDASERWAGITQILGETDLDIVQNGGLMVAETGEQVAVLERKLRLEQEGGLPVQILSGDALQDMAPWLSPKVIAATYCPIEGHGNPRLITFALARAARRFGVDIRTWAEVTGLQRTAGHWQVDYTTPDGVCHTVTTDAVLNAAGAWADRVGAMAGVHLPIFPVGLTMSVTDRAAPVVPVLVQHVGRRLSLKQMREGNLLIGGGWASRLSRNRQGFDIAHPAIPRPDSIRGNISTAIDVVPALSRRMLLRSWTGITGVTADQLPLLGEVAAAPGFFVAAGGAGFTLGLTYASQIAQLMGNGSSSLDIALYSPERFAHMNMYMG